MSLYPYGPRDVAVWGGKKWLKSYKNPWMNMARADFLYRRSKYQKRAPLQYWGDFASSRKQQRDAYNRGFIKRRAKDSARLPWHKRYRIADYNPSRKRLHNQDERWVKRYKRTPPGRRKKFRFKKYRRSKRYSDRNTKFRKHSKRKPRHVIYF